MQITHRITVTSSPRIRRELAGMGIVIADSGIVSFELNEAHEAWPHLERWLVSNKALDIASTTFSKAETEAAEWVNFLPNWHHGYPQPREQEFGYLEATYDLSHHCPRCGTGLKQKAPFQMKGEPKWGRNHIMQLNWVFDEYFVPPQVWREVFEPHGIACRPVLGKKGVELQTVVQLDVHEEVDVDTGPLRKEEDACAVCKRVKYLPHTRGYFPAMLSEPAGHMVRTRQEFGSGASASRYVLMSQRLLRAVEERKLRGYVVHSVAARVDRMAKHVLIECPAAGGPNQVVSASVSES